MLATISTCHNHHHHHHKLDSPYNKTRCQLCKRLAWPMIPLSWSGLVWKRVSTMNVITRGQSTPIYFPVYWAIFGMVQACSWPVKRRSFAIIVPSSEMSRPTERGVGLVPSLFNFDGNRQHSWSASCWKRWDGLWLRRQWLCSLMQRSLVLEIIQHSCLCLNSTILPFVWHSISQNIYFLPM